MVLVSMLVGVVGGCSSGMKKVDARIDALLRETSAELGQTEVTPRMSRLVDAGRPTRDVAAYTREQVPTVNPSASALRFDPAAEADDVARRLAEYNELPAGTPLLTLTESLSYSMAHSREYRFAEEQYVIAAIRLLQERHRWGPRFFDDVSTTITSDGTDHMFNSAVSVVNDLSVTQRLPYGGTVSARLLARATEDLHQRVAALGRSLGDAIVAVAGTNHGSDAIRTGPRAAARWEGEISEARERRWCR